MRFAVGILSTRLQVIEVCCRPLVASDLTVSATALTEAGRRDEECPGGRPAVEFQGEAHPASSVGGGYVSWLER
jgi:hypothetical protein